MDGECDPYQIAGVGHWQAIENEFEARNRAANVSARAEKRRSPQQQTSQGPKSD